MAQARSKSGSKRKGGRGASGGSSASSLWPWLGALAVIGGGIGLYENSSAVRHFVTGLKAESPLQVAAKPAVSPDRQMPPRSVMGGAPRAMPPRPATPPDQSQTAGIIPPAPIGRPAIDAAKPSEALRPGERLAGAYEAKFYLCGSAKQDDCVVSADRFVFHGQRIRLVGVEVPDIKKPHCEGERIKASDAELRVRAFLDSGPFELVTWQGNDAEVDGHRLREVTRNGMSLGDILVREGLAKRPGGKGSWCH